MYLYFDRNDSYYKHQFLTTLKISTDGNNNDVLPSDTDEYWHAARICIKCNIGSNKKIKL